MVRVHAAVSSFVLNGALCAKGLVPVINNAVGQSGFVPRFQISDVFLKAETAILRFCVPNREPFIAGIGSACGNFGDCHQFAETDPTQLLPMPPLYERCVLIVFCSGGRCLPRDGHCPVWQTHCFFPTGTIARSTKPIVKCVPSDARTTFSKYETEIL